MSRPRAASHASAWCAVPHRTISNTPTIHGNRRACGEGMPKRFLSAQASTCASISQTLRSSWKELVVNNCIVRSKLPHGLCRRRHKLICGHRAVDPSFLAVLEVQRRTAGFDSRKVHSHCGKSAKWSQINATFKSTRHTPWHAQFIDMCTNLGVILKLLKRRMLRPALPGRVSARFILESISIRNVPWCR